MPAELRPGAAPAAVSAAATSIVQDKVKDSQHTLASQIPGLSAMAADLVKDLDPQVRSLIMLMSTRALASAAEWTDIVLALQQRLVHTDCAELHGVPEDAHNEV
jgi:hypothetical protein